MKVCNECFEDVKIQTYIESHGTSVAAGYVCRNCGNSSGVTHEMDAMQLSEKLQSVILKFYTHEHEHGLYGSARSYCDDGEDPAVFAGLSNLNDVCYDLFSDDSQRLADFIVSNRNWRYEADGGDTFFDSAYDEVWKGNCWFDQGESLWSDFSEKVKYTARFFDHASYSRTEFLESLVRMFDDLTTSRYPTIFHRARPIDSEETKERILSNPKKELDKPPQRYAGYNRFSPAGISYIYLADSLNTALVEIRSPVGQENAYAEFELPVGLRIINLRKRTLLKHLDCFDEEFSSSLFCFLSAFTHNIAQPIEESDKLIDYVPTQTVSEFIWSKGYDGFLYDSSLSWSGYNLVVFENRYELKRYGTVEKLDGLNRVMSSQEISD